MTATLSSAAWVVHDIGLAAAIGGPLFENTALAPALERSTSAGERDRIAIDAAQRYSMIKLISHAAFAVPWVIGRTMRSGREVSADARALTLAKDVLVGISVVSGAAGLVSLRRAATRVEGNGRQGASGSTNKVPTRSGILGALSVVNTAANAGILGITALLAMQGSKSARFSWFSRWLP